MGRLPQFAGAIFGAVLIAGTSIAPKGVCQRMWLSQAGRRTSAPGYPARTTRNRACTSEH